MSAIKVTPHEELVEKVKAEIAHNITPVIGWLRLDAKMGRDDSDKQNLYEYRARLQKAAEAIAVMIEEKKLP